MSALRCGLAVLVLAGCTVDRGAHPMFAACETDAQCPSGRRCDRGFCVLEGDGGCGPEVPCNGADDDCDGDTDEIDVSACESGALGICSTGTLVCAGARPLCERTVVPEPEVCNGLDDDCDGQTDEEAPSLCYPEGAEGCVEGEDGLVCRGACRAGSARCADGVLGACEGAVTPVEEVCGASIARDDDCDGVIDEECPCEADQVCYGGPDGTDGVGACREGIQRCVDGTLDSTCADQVLPRAETCANMGIDDDCDGVLDDVLGAGEPCRDDSVMGDCRVGRLACAGDGPSPVCVPGTPREERCDGGDDDCDGRVDEAFDLSADEANCGACGVACGADQTCCGGTCADPRASSDHCGGCASDGGEVCMAGEVCCNGECAEAEACASCMEDCGAMGRECCSGACVDPEMDESHCGGCGIACGAGEVCCGGACVASDADHCGQSCGACEAGSELCCDGACVPIDEQHCNSCTSSCSIGDCCPSGCVDLENDPNHCGACGMRCPSGQSCNQGHCCPSGQSWCEAQGTCRDLANDDDNCGACGNACNFVSPCCRSGACHGLIGLGC